MTDRTQTPATSNPLGVKGVGEAGTIASTPAVVNAVIDALRPFGVTDVRDAVHAAAGLAGHQRGQGRRAMIPAQFDYIRPSSLAEATAALAGGGEDAKVIAGGQSLLPLLRLRLAYPALLVDIGGLG